MARHEANRKSKIQEAPKNQKWIWTALASGSADIVERNDPGPDFDWNGSTKTYGTPLMAAIFSGPRTNDQGCTDFVTDGEEQFQNRLRLIRWMIVEKGTDPKREETAGCITDKSWSIILEDDEVQSHTKIFSFQGHSAFSALLEVRLHMTAAEGFCSDIQRVDRILEVFSNTRPKEKAGRPQTLVVHEGVVETWERFLDDDASKDLVISCTRRGEVLASLRAHAALLASASVVVRVMLAGPMREGALRTIDVECQPEAMRLLLSLVYTGTSAADGDQPLATEVALGCLDVAHRWDVRHVVRMLVSQLRSALSLDSLEQIWEAAALKQEQELLAACRGFAHNSAEALRPRFQAGQLCRLVSEELAERVFLTDAAQSPAAKRRRTFCS